MAAGGGGSDGGGASRHCLEKKEMGKGREGEGLAGTIDSFCHRRGGQQCGGTVASMDRAIVRWGGGGGGSRTESSRQRGEREKKRYD